MIVLQSSAPVAAVYDRRLCALCNSAANLNSKPKIQHSKLPSNSPTFPKPGQACPRPLGEGGGVANGDQPYYKPSQAASAYVNLCQAPLPPTPGLASSGVKPLSSAVKLGQAQSSSFQEKKDCLFFMNLVFNIRVHPWLKQNLEL
jgi:hypothetical protein